MAIILDADVIISGEKGAFDLRAWFERLPEEQFEIAAITVAELWHGVERADASNRRKRSQYLKGLLEMLPVIPYMTDRSGDGEDLPPGCHGCKRFALVRIE